MYVPNDISPVAKPRMTQRDKWQPSKAAGKYFSFCNHIRHLANLKGLYTLPGVLNSLIFNIQMPQSWSSKKKAEMNDMPHESTPDLDNLLKSLDCFGEDRHIHSIGSIKKVWAYEGSIILEIDQEQEPEEISHGSDIYRNL